jgi:hypothetical protein
VKKFLCQIILIAFLSGCTQEDAERGKSLINIYLIDAPAYHGQLWVELLGVEVQVIGTRGMDNADPLFLDYTPADKQVNISALIAGNQLLVGRGEFFVGTVTDITLRLGTNNYLMVNNQRIPLTFESPEDNTPVVNVDFELQPGISHDYYLDFDIFRSVKQIGNGQDVFRLNPQISAFSKLGTGEISGSVRPLEINAYVHAIQETDTLTTLVDTVGSGGFMFQGLIGSYKVVVQPTRDDYFSETLEAVVVQKGKETKLGNIDLQKK